MNENLIQGISVMCIGMGTVLAFLCITIAAMHIMSAIVGKLNQIFPEAVPQVASGKARKTVSDDAEIAAAIVAAMFKK
jgi:sodium pump decarboxylase gamma subunit